MLSSWGSHGSTGDAGGHLEPGGTWSSSRKGRVDMGALEHEPQAHNAEGR